MSKERRAVPEQTINDALSQQAGRVTPVISRRHARAAPQLAGRFNYTTMVRNRPCALGRWRVTTTTPHIAERIAQHLGGRVQHDLVRGLAETMTESSAVDILLAGPEDLYVGWRHAGWGVCDSGAQDQRRSCSCPADFAQRRAAAKRGYGCVPRAEIAFRLRCSAELGVFEHLSDDWSFVELVIATHMALRGLDGPAVARLEVVRTHHTLHSGRLLSYTRPVIALLDASQQVLL
jgi:hypothetical protein